MIYYAIINIGMGQFYRPARVSIVMANPQKVKVEKYLVPQKFTNWGSAVTILMHEISVMLIGSTPIQIIPQFVHEKELL
jgi:hypothetical protein